MRYQTGRRAPAWRVAITLEADFCIEGLEEALARHGKLEIFNTDKGGPFTREGVTDLLLDSKIKIGTDGKGVWRNNVFIKRLWRTVKYEELLYLRA